MRCFIDEKSKSCNLAGVLLMAVMLMAVCAQAAVVPSSKQMLELKPGWNLVTLTKPLDPMPGNVQKFLSLKPMRYDDASGAYVACNDSENLKAGVGYWVFSRGAQTIELALDVNAAVDQPVLKKGWNLIGMTDGASWPNSGMVSWAWESGRFKQVDVKDLQAGQAYWAWLP